MEQDNQPQPAGTTVPAGCEPNEKSGTNEGTPFADRDSDLRRIFIGPQGLRAGWSAAVFLMLCNPFGVSTLNLVIFTAMNQFGLIGPNDELGPKPLFFSETGALLALIAAIVIMGRIEGRGILEYNLTGPRRTQHFFFGLGTGFAGLSALVGALEAGGWLRIGHAALSTTDLLRFALLWGCVFLVTGFFEEGMFRCYLQFTFTRGIDFWWAAGTLAIVCAYEAISVGGTASWGVYLAALLGVFPCLVLHRRSAPRAGFWCAAWVTSTLFGVVHVGNSGEAWIGIFAAAFIGFVFCVSIRVTGSAWWAIGCHAAWDWAETYFYGTADSGLKPQGSYLTSTPAGNPLWSGGTVGPEGSLLVIAAILLLLALLHVYGRLGSRAQASAG